MCPCVGLFYNDVPLWKCKAGLNSGSHSPLLVAHWSFPPTTHFKNCLKITVTFQVTIFLAHTYFFLAAYAENLLFLLESVIQGCQLWMRVRREICEARPLAAYKCRASPKTSDKQATTTTIFFSSFSVRYFHIYMHESVRFRWNGVKCVSLTLNAWELAALCYLCHRMCRTHHTNCSIKGINVSK